MLCAEPLPLAPVTPPTLGVPGFPRFPQLPPMSENMQSALIFGSALVIVTGLTFCLASISMAVDRRRKRKKALGMSDDVWPASSHRTLRETEEEIAVFDRSIPEWEKRYKTRWPGDGYAKVMRAQQHRLRRELKLGPPGQLSLKF